MTKYLRKVIVFVIGVAVAIIADRFMEINFYDKFLDFLSDIIIFLFAANGIEHIAKSIKNFRNGGN